MAHRLTLAPLPIDADRVVFDITRLYRNRLSVFGTGIDRIDLAIGLDLAGRFGDACRFVHVCYGGFAEMAGGPARALMQALDRRWHDGAGRGGANLDASLALGRAKAAFRGGFGDDGVYVVASHSGLPQRAGYLDRFDPSRRMRRLAYIHDLIPLDYPEYQTPRSRLIFRRYLAELARGPVSFAANSADTARRLTDYASAQGWKVGAPLVATPSLQPAVAPAAAVPARLAPVFAKGPVFTVLGTIEPRKNHLLLLTLWRRMAEAGEAPQLLVIGKRGWMNDNIVALLDDCAAIQPFVTEANGLSDAEIAAVLKASRAMLFPSFAEGLGIPMLEAKAAGLPVIASDLPALREIAAADTVFLDPLDGLGWREAILAAAIR